MARRPTRRRTSCCSTSDLATLSIIGLVLLAIGWREAIVVAIVIPVTILLTLFAAWVMGYTLNRVSLFALIFSIGILVDDAIVVIENIARHWGMNDGRTRVQAAIDAVAEVGNPTIVATLTVVAALLPMLFVSGLMGPYMSPIPANASRRDDLFLLRRGHHHALADGQDRRQAHMRWPWRTWRRRPSGGGLLGRAYTGRRPPPARHQGAQPGFPARDRGCCPSARWRCFTPATSRSSCCPSTTSPSCRW